MNERFVGINIDRRKPSFLYDLLGYEVEDSDIHMLKTLQGSMVRKP